MALAPKSHVGGLQRLRFASYELRADSGELLRSGERVAVQRKTLELLVCLTEHPGRLFTREELYERLWPAGTFVDFEHGLNTVVRKLRRALQDSTERPRFVETLPGSGYRFIARVDALEHTAAAAAAGATSWAARLARPPLLGRERELARLEARLRDARGGRGGVVLVGGEPGIGKTRLLEELGAVARRSGFRTLAGRCAPGDGAAPYAPFVEATSAWVHENHADAMRDVADPAVWAVISKLVPFVRERLRDLASAPPLRPDEERTRLLDAIAKLAGGLAKREGALFVLDDLHCADAPTLAVLVRLSRVAGSAPLLVVGGFRDVEIDPAHPLSQILDALARESPFEQLALAGLDAESVRTWLGLASEAEVGAEFAAEVLRATGGNPLFLRELVLDWTRDGLRAQAARRAGSGVPVPATVRTVVERRLAKLSDDARTLLGCAAAFPGAFVFEPAAASAGLGIEEALDALDEAQSAHLVRPCGGPDDYEFVHALIRSVLYESLTPARRVRVHRRLAQEMASEQAAGGPARDAEIAEQYLRSRELPGVEAGVPHALAAAERAEAAVDFDAAARLLGAALELLPSEDARRTRFMVKRALALAWAGSVQDAVRSASDAADALALAEGPHEAARFLADATDAIWLRTYDPLAWLLAFRGVRHAGDRRDWTWVRLASHQLLAEEVMNSVPRATPSDSPLRREVFARMVENRDRLPAYQLNELWRCAIFESRSEARAVAGSEPLALVYWIGDYRRGVELYRARVAESETRGEIAGAAILHATLSLPEMALGELDRARESAARAAAWRDRAEPTPLLEGALRGNALELARVRGRGLEPALDRLREHGAGGFFADSFLGAQIQACLAAPLAFLGRCEEALAALERALPAIERAPGWAPCYPATVAFAVEALWLLDQGSPHLELIERCLREKVLAPDFRFPNVDARLSLARVCALTRRWDEASHWLSEARRVLEEQGARPLRATADFDEALIWARRRKRGGAPRARQLCEAARLEFDSIGMPGWRDRAAELQVEIERLED